MLDMSEAVVDLSYTQNAPYATGIVEYGLAVFKMLHERYPSIQAIVSSAYPPPEKLPSGTRLCYVDGTIGSKEYWRNVDKLLETKRLAFFPYQVLDHKFKKSGCRLFFTYHDITPLTEWRFCKLNHKEIQYCASFKKRVFYFAKQLIRLVGVIYRRRKAVMGHNLKIAEIVFADSETTRQDIIRAFKVADANKVVTVFGPRKVRSTSSEDSKLSYRDFFLIVSANRYLKNTIPALKALDKMWDEGEKRRVIVTGNPNSRVLNVVRHKDMVIPMGYVSDSDLDYLYRNASVFIFPSVSEGLGMPPLEALQFGTRVASSNAMSLGEIYRDLPLFDPYDVEGIVAAIRKADALPSSFFKNAFSMIATATDYRLDLVCSCFLGSNRP